jgi:hypothetical protein
MVWDNRDAANGERWKEFASEKLFAMQTICRVCRLAWNAPTLRGNAARVASEATT